jgi:hypothetical protein
LTTSATVLADRAPEVDFDLSIFREIDRKWKGYHSYIRAGAACAFGLLELYYLAIFLSGLGRSAGSPNPRIEALGGFDLVWGVVVYLIAVSTVPFFSGASRLLVDSAGIHLQYPGGQRDDLLWSDQRLRITLFDFSGQPLWVQANRAYRMERTRKLPAFGPSHRRTLLTRDAFEAVVSAARRNGLSVRRYRASTLAEIGRPEVYQIDSPRRA